MVPAAATRGYPASIKSIDKQVLMKSTDPTFNLATYSVNIFSLQPPELVEQFVTHPNFEFWKLKS